MKLVAHKMSFTGDPTRDALNAVVTLVRNRTGKSFHDAFNQVSTANQDLLKPSIFPPGVENLWRVLNRTEEVTGLSPSQSQQIATDRISALARQLVPVLEHYPVAFQWDVMWRAACTLDAAGVGCRVSNRQSNDPEVDRSDWKQANAYAEDVFALLASEKQPVDRGTMAAFQSPHLGMVRNVFRNAIQRLMGEQGLDERQAFDRIKADEPIFWTLAMLSFEPEKISEPAD